MLGCGTGRSLTTHHHLLRAARSCPSSDETGTISRHGGSDTHSAPAGSITDRFSVLRAPAVELAVAPEGSGLEASAYEAIKVAVSAVIPLLRVVARKPG